MPEWRLLGQYVKNCNCAPGCPCDFWARPTNGSCVGMSAMHILEGRFDALKLDGLNFAVCYHWPGALHEGNGTLQPYIDARATSEQITALLTIFSGRAGNAWYQLNASIVSKIHKPKFVPIEFEFDLERRHARVKAGDEAETITEPIRNPVTGEEHRILVEMPRGIEYERPEIATTKLLRSTGAVAFDFPASHSSLAIVEQTNTGLVHKEHR